MNGIATTERKKRSRKAAFYATEKPVISSNNEVVFNCQAVLPPCSITYLLDTNGSVEIGSSGRGDNFDGIQDIELIKHEYQPSKRYEIGISQTIGKNDRMQDTANVLGELFPNIDIIGIFDGHNGEEAARYCLISMKNEFNCLNPKDCEHQLPQIFESIHNNISSQTISGTTASICIIRSDDVVLAHVGDSPIYFYENGHLTRMTQNHSATFEKERIIASGGKVINIKGVDRVNGQINLSRSLGDKLLQPPLTYKPDISIHSLSMKYIVIVTDGVTDSLSDSEMEIILSQPLSPDQIAATIRNNAFINGSVDNISVIVIQII
ncbi:protein phosphatase domain containing protein [Entamoeba histolytica HM-1:IMSS-B]|uniref:Protein phosphatase domain-containing protein n=5 Tax=Entamoeba histolytica TaxID=5759 RepID=C4M1S4_ENTH1|nr:protein phosphatase domain-containing protein [Entamoeba histolytica HM-1:IMSS]EMD42447.1 protein phosphatase domain containing protein [Entamoeba histolytica KU27]EMH77639.1 protein phosphatase domain containing protein [Entamoeba histolytica HM-1:IMSS-B]ENY64226.1 protein phosphatase domain containing protein [Entamoeba histolytica HM-1:IMSS-A]GAT95185.1 protein phosphatase domain-containing protein [Entamoeba histolytica]EAL49045.2 protein phosphatase domain-containing protein [Entamoeba|eukprot:XP_654431.2 protein phosphatase domain-containing protein [Entamoeba histolytica HM-1:IMSS]